MREIKFRAWHPDENKMYYFKNFKEITDWQNGDSYRLDNYEYANIEFMQYTGLKDKNGKEIYEGDIVKSYYYIPNQDGTEGERYVVKLINYDETLCKYNIDMFENLEIIGNLWDNPELLEEGE